VVAFANRFNKSPIMKFETENLVSLSLHSLLTFISWGENALDEHMYVF